MRSSRLLAAALLVSCASAPPRPARRVSHSPGAAGAADAARVRALADDYVAGFRAQEPVSTFLRGLALEHHDALPDNGLPALAAWHRREDAWATSLAKIDAHGLWGRPEWALRGLLAHAIESSSRTRICRLELWGVAQFGW